MTRSIDPLGVFDGLFDAARKDDAMARFARHVSPGKRAFYRGIGLELVMGRRGGAFFEDVAGRRLLNCHCNGGVFNLGHRHPGVGAVLRAASEALDMGNHHLMSAARARAAERLAESCPGDLEQVVFAATGGEAIDTAIKLARAHTGRPGVLSARGGYHGHTGLALAAGDEAYRAPFGPLAPGFRQVPFDDRDALARELAAGDVACVLLEPVPATLGMPIASDGYFAAVRALCDEHDALLVADEVQTGLGRTGRRWAIEHFDVVPDLLVSAKGLGGGYYPMAATVLRPAVGEILRRDPFIHISTTGGAELGCAVMIAVLDLLDADDFLPRVRAVAAALADGLEALRAAHPTLVAVRQLGMMIGLELADETRGQLFCRAAAENGLFCVYANNDKRVVQFLLPLTVSDDEVALALGGVDKTLSMLEGLGS